MKITFNRFETIHRQPEKSGWYDTDKGNLFWFDNVFEWSCRDDYVSHEYPKYWYEIVPHRMLTDLETLKLIKQMFELHSDHSTRCNGYRSLCKIIEDRILTNS